MKWYSHPTYIKHLTDIKQYEQGVGTYYKWVPKLAGRFNREYASIGILDFNDLIQAGHEGLIRAWPSIDWEMIGASSEPQAQLWSFLKKRILWGIRREIDNHSSHIKVPRRILDEQRKNMDFKDRIFADLFPRFFDTAFPDLIEDMQPWESILLGEIIDDYL